jgi:membrane-bound lytic murein transglycosylase D
VQRAIARNLRRGLPTDYVSLNLPPETRGYVPKLQAVKNIVMRPASYGLALPPLENHPYFLSVPIERDIDVDLAAKMAGVSLDEFRMLNPQFNKPVILAAGTPQVLLPYDNADDFMKALDAHKGPLASWTVWRAGRTLRPADAAKQIGMSEAELRDVNHIPPRMLVKAGSTLLVPRAASHTSDVSEQVAESAAMSLAPDLPPTRRVNVRIARGGESVASVARRMHVSASQVAEWNHVAESGKFGAGTTAVIFVPRQVAVARAPVRTRTSAHAAHAAPAHAAAAHKPASTVARTGSSPKAAGGAGSAQSAKTKTRIAQH